MLHNTIKSLTTLGLLGFALTVTHLQAEETKLNTNTSTPEASSNTDAKPATITITTGMEKDWVRPKEEELKKKLTPLQYKVTQKDGTERPFQNDYWDNKEAGIYVDVVSGEALFSSTDKFKSGTGWPSFSKPLHSSNITQHSDKSAFMERVEVRSKHADSHLGHVFDDGPGPNGLRYCINSASLRFIPVKDLKKEGYGAYLPLFQQEKKADK